ncbi:MAG: GlmU family protein [Bacteroidales bacterium]|jgi:UDP-N-acetylglucosamine diphosphorylase/glucosamine-1-phosphate N-acetyltransferase|nr:GlmU family protein [Bacteroidales bacterium]
MNYILFDDKSWQNLLPLTFTRPVGEIRAGILTLKEKWEHWLQQTVSYKTEDYLSGKYPLKVASDNILINGSVIPNQKLIEKIQLLGLNQALIADQKLLAVRIGKDELPGFDPAQTGHYEREDFSREFIAIEWPWEIFKLNEINLKTDFDLLTRDRKSQPLSKSNNRIGNGQIFIEEGAIVEFATLNTSTGPIYLGKNAEVMEGSIIRGPFALCDHGVLKMGARIYGPTTIGPYSKVGGEVNNSVIIGYSNKGHDGFLGNSVIGEWCNLGADTNNSNLKNNYAEVRLWNYENERFIKTGLQFCGLIMGDHSKCAINTMFNTGTVVGVNANIFGEGFPRNFVPSFSWGGARGFTIYGLDKAFEVAEKVMERRNKILDDQEKEILTHIFEKTSKYRMY